MYEDFREKKLKRYKIKGTDTTLGHFLLVFHIDSKGLQTKLTISRKHCSLVKKKNSHSDILLSVL